MRPRERFRWKNRSPWIPRVAMWTCRDAMPKPSARQSSRVWAGCQSHLRAPSTLPKPCPNAIVYTSADRTLGIGAGQMSRVDSSRIAVWKAKEAGLDLKGSIIASDAMFPFADGLQSAIEAGATACIQPGGSIRDEEVIAAADAAGMAMVFTGHRHFRH